MDTTSLESLQFQECVSLNAMGNLLDAREINAWRAIPSFARFCTQSGSVTVLKVKRRHGFFEIEGFA